MRYHYRWKRIALILLMPSLAFGGIFTLALLRNAADHEEFGVQLPARIIKVAHKTEAKHEFLRTGLRRRKAEVEFIMPNGEKWYAKRQFEDDIVKGEGIRAWVRNHKPAGEVWFEKEFEPEAWEGETFLVTPWETFLGLLWISLLGAGIFGGIVDGLLIMAFRGIDDHKSPENGDDPDIPKDPEPGGEQRLEATEQQAAAPLVA